MHLYTEAKALATELLEECGGDFEEALDRAMEWIDGHEVAIYYHKAIQFCAEQNTSAGEQWLEECGGIVHDGDTFGGIACRIAFATLYVELTDVLAEMQQQAELDANGHDEPAWMND